MGQAQWAGLGKSSPSFYKKHFVYAFIYLAVPGLSRSMWDLQILLLLLRHENSLVVICRI